MSTQKPPSGLRVFGFIYGFARPYYFPLITGTLLYCSQQVMFPLINAALSGSVTNAILNKNNSMLVTAILSTLGLFTMFVIMVYPGIMLYAGNGLKTTRRMQTKLFRAFVSADTEGRAHSGERLSSLNTDVGTASQLYQNGLAVLLMCVMPIIMLSSAVFALDWRVGLYTLAVGLFALVGQYLFAKPIAKIAEGKLSTTAEATKTIGDIFSGGVIARVFQLQDNLLKAFGKSNDELMRLAHREARIDAAQKLFAGLSELLASGGVFVVGSILISRGEMTLVSLMASVPMCASIANALTNIGGAYAGMQAPLTAGRRIYAQLGGDNRLDPLPDVEKLPSVDGYKIEVKDLTFSFKGAATPTLVDVNLSIDENRLAAFVGESGSGKSTLLKLIAGLYNRADLNISVGDACLSSEPIERWRARFAYVDQSCTLFNLSIAENIALGKENATRDEVLAAAREADADGFITTLPLSYDTPVGEVGAALSGGQRQRIAIARALIRHAPILVFDEATSALDHESEREVITTINSLRANHTILMATHNIGSIQPDVIFRLVNGRIATNV